MFGKKKSPALFNAVDDSRIVVHDFRLRGTQVGFESYRTVEYHLYRKLEEAYRLFAGDIDDANGDMMDAILFSAAREALPDLGKQHCDHLDMLRRLIIRHKADREDLRRIRDDRVEEYESMKADYERTCKMLAREYEEV